MTDPILDILQKKGIIDEKVRAIAEDLVTRGKTLEQALVGAKYVSDTAFAEAQAEAYGVPFLDVSDAELNPDVVNMVPKQTLTAFKMVPLSFKDNKLTVLLRNPQDYRAVESLEFLAGEKDWDLQIATAPASQINKLVKTLSGLEAEIETSLEAAKGKYEKEKEESAPEGNIEDIIKGAPVSRMLSVIMRHAVDGGASDIHIEPVGNESRIRYRIDGVLRTTLTLPIYVHPALVSRVKVLANLKIDETRIPQDGRITQEINNKKIDFRISTLPVVEHEKVVMRILDTTAGAPTLERLGFRKEYIAIMKEEIKQPHGLFLITGPTGSGKSTTLFSALNLLNSDGVNISTLEDPVEYYIEGVNQSQVRPEIGYTFAAGLRSLLRQDPNVVMVGEIRDRETAELAIHASLTGHLIFSTLHTNDVYGLVPRLLDMGLEPFLLAATMNLGVAQRLARKICDFCKEEEEIPEITRKQLMDVLQTIPKKYLTDVDITKKITFYHGKGCPKCGGIGYSGRTAVAELFQFSDKAKRLVESGFSREEFQKEFDKQEMITLYQDLTLKAAEGLTTVEEVMRLAQDTSDTDDELEKPPEPNLPEVKKKI
ncbi:MAG: GspE/PulE family protein [Patescibacteria group bacterium]|nr:GspE/PulE family protein [Patescibacteria group bacterium]